MHKYRYLHIICFFFGITLNSSAYSFETTVRFQTLQDSVYIDTDYINQREYEDLTDKYDGDEFIYERTIENSGWWTRFKQWLADLFKDLFDFETSAKAADVSSFVINALFIIIFLLVVFFIVRAIINKEGNWVFGKSSDKGIIPVTDIENNIYETDFKSLINNAEENNNYRLVIRYYYLWLLRSLSEAEVINYDVEKTNNDYYLEIKNERTKNDFSYTSYLYNYIWYGEFDIDEHQFKKAKDAFTQFLNSIRK